VEVRPVSVYLQLTLVNARLRLSGARWHN